MATMEAPPRLQVRLHQGAFKNEPFVDFNKLSLVLVLLDTRPVKLPGQ